VLLKYGRDEELEADRLGMRYMSNVGYNPRGQLLVMQVLEKLSSGSKQPEILSTHPDPKARIEQVQKLLSTQYAQTQNNPNYKEYAERYKSDFLDVIKKLPPAPKPQQKASLPAGVPAEALVDLSDSTTWCAFCAAAAKSHSKANTKEPGPVPPREGIYAFFRPPTP
jgi:predicted Zn-dependent protease